jgi:two-component system nitrate/nitrite sensor histidine kinase NarX
VEKNILAVRWVTFLALIVTAVALLLPRVERSSVNNIAIGLLVIFAAAMLTWAVETWLRYLVSQLGVASREVEKPGGANEQGANLLLAASHDLWSAKVSREIIEIVMRTGLRLLNADGASFIDFNEWKTQPEALTMGIVPSTGDGDWKSRLAYPGTRQVCRMCSLREAGAGCVLGEDVKNPFLKVYCLPIMSGENEYGLVNFFFTDPVEIRESDKKYLRLLTDNAEMALENLHVRERGTAALTHLDSSQSKNEFKSLIENLSLGLKHELNILSVIFWLPSENEGDYAAKLLSSAIDGVKVLDEIGNKGLAMELWQEVLETNRPFYREVIDDLKGNIGLLVVPISGLIEKPIGMMVCTYDVVKHDLLPLLPVLRFLGQNIYALLQVILLADQMEYRAARDERFRLAREIHDGLAQTLAYLKIQTAQMLNYLNNGKMDNLETSLSSSYQTLSEAYQDARREIDDLRFVAETDTQDWLVSLALGFRDDTGLEVDVSKLHINAMLPLAVQSQLIRIAQEALNNVRQHAQAEKVAIAGSIQAGEVVLEISDNGRGFEPETVDIGSRYGLVGMRERTDMVGGEFQIISMQDRGTTIRVSIPLSGLK